MTVFESCVIYKPETRHADAHHHSGSARWHVGAADTAATTAELLSDYLNQRAFAPPAVEFTVENLFPRSEIQLAFRNRDDNFAPHDLTLEMGVSVVFARPVVSVGVRWGVRR